MSGADEDVGDIRDDGDDDLAPAAEVRFVKVATAEGRIDRALADAAPDLSRSRIQTLISQGAVWRGDQRIGDPAQGPTPGRYRLEIPPPTPAVPQPEPIALTVLFEDAHLIVVDKPAGIAVHPAPGSETGTLVNALIAHCGASLSGVGGVARPGIVHRLDKDTSGVMVAAKTDAAHRGLGAQFERHDIERIYLAFTRGAPAPPSGTIATRLARSPHNRKKMAVVRSGGREAVTRYETERRYGPAGRPFAARLACRLETGRTHQIRVHLAQIGAPCLADPLYGAGAPATSVKAAIAKTGLARQALHAAVLGFVHPITGEKLRFESPLPADLAALQEALEAL